MKKKSNFREFLTIIKYYGPYKWLFFSDLLAAAITAGVALVIPR